MIFCQVASDMTKCLSSSYPMSLTDTMIGSDKFLPSLCIAITAVSIIWCGFFVSAKVYGIVFTEGAQSMAGRHDVPGFLALQTTGVFEFAIHQAVI